MKCIIENLFIENFFCCNIAVFFNSYSYTSIQCILGIEKKTQVKIKIFSS